MPKSFTVLFTAHDTGQHVGSAAGCGPFATCYNSPELLRRWKAPGEGLERREFSPGIPEFLRKPRAECTITVVNRGPKGCACTGTHKTHTGRNSCSKMCKFTPTQSSIHSLLQLRSDRIDGPQGSISLHTSDRSLLNVV